MVDIRKKLDSTTKPLYVVVDRCASGGDRVLLLHVVPFEPFFESTRQFANDCERAIQI
jgi:hypothetical protein